MKSSEIISLLKRTINNVKPFVKPEKKAEPAAVKEKTETQEQPPVKMIMLLLPKQNLRKQKQLNRATEANKAGKGSPDKRSSEICFV